MVLAEQRPAATGAGVPPGGLDAKPTLVIDPNLLSPDGSVAMAQWSPSPDGRWLAYTRAAGGSDVEDIHVRDLTTGKDLADVVLHVKFTGIGWTRDSKGFFYSRFKGTESSADFAEAIAVHQVWYHWVDGASRIAWCSSVRRTTEAVARR